MVCILQLRGAQIDIDSQILDFRNIVIGYLVIGCTDSLYYGCVKSVSADISYIVENISELQFLIGHWELPFSQIGSYHSAEYGVTVLQKEELPFPLVDSGCNSLIPPSCVLLSAVHCSCSGFNVCLATKTYMVTVELLWACIMM